MADYKVPGVHVEEPFELALSIPAGETAIPVFACDNVTNSKIPGLKDGQEIQSWLDVSQLIAGEREQRQKKVDETVDKAKVDSSVMSKALAAVSVTAKVVGLSKALVVANADANAMSKALVGVNAAAVFKSLANADTAAVSKALTTAGVTANDGVAGKIVDVFKALANADVDAVSQALSAANADSVFQALASKDANAVIQALATVGVTVNNDVATEIIGVFKALSDADAAPVSKAVAVFKALASADAVAVSKALESICANGVAEAVIKVLVGENVVSELRNLQQAQKQLDGLNDSLLDDPLYLSLKAYFDNGGGRAYVMNVDSLEEKVPGFDDITLLVQAGAEFTAFNGPVQKLCKTGKTYFAVFDGPSDEINSAGQVDKADEKGTKEEATASYDPNHYTAAYYPWLQADWAIKSNNDRVDISPSAAVAGAYCTVDRERGVWKAPANVALKGGVTPKFKVSDDVNEKLNVPSSGGKSINVIREFRGTGPLIWGARTLKSNLDTWRYVSVRRLFNAVEKDVRSAMGVAVFEPNSAPTWERVRSAIDIYLHGLWKQGALQGNTPEQAYFVQVGLGQTMTQTHINKGEMIVQIGLAAVRPAEFIILQVSQKQLSVA